MRRVFRILFEWGLVALALALFALWLMLDARPAVESGGPIERADLLWAKQVFRQNDPRGRAPETLQTLTLNAGEVNRLLRFSSLLRAGSAAQVELQPGRLRVLATLRVPENPFGTALNVAAEFDDRREQGLYLTRLHLGSLPVPGPLARALMALTERRARSQPLYNDLARSFSRLRYQEDRLVLDYRWHPELFAAIERRSAAALLSPADRERLLAYGEFLRRFVVRWPKGSTHRLVEVVNPLFAFSASRPRDPAAENRAALLALGAYLAGVSPEKLLEGRGHSNRLAPPVLLTLHGRRDAAEHLVIAAALAATLGPDVANALGAAKEEADLIDGSGFSFTDIAADRSGARLGAAAVGPRAQAVRDALMWLAGDATLAPDFTRLPEFLPQKEFDRRFQAVGSTAYRAQIAAIDAQLDRHPLLGRR
jgi:hypothetical protein